MLVYSDFVVSLLSLQHPCGAFGCDHPGRSQLTEEKRSGRLAAWLIKVFVCSFRMFYKVECLKQLLFVKCKCFYHNEHGHSLNVFFLANIQVDIGKTVHLSMFKPFKPTFKPSLTVKFLFLLTSCLSNHTYAVYILSVSFLIIFLSGVYIQPCNKLQFGSCIKMHNSEKLPIRKKSC